MTGPEPPSLSDAEVIAALRAAAQRGLRAHPRAQVNADDFGYDIEGISELVAGCEERELHKHEPDHEFPRRNDYIVVLRIEAEGERMPFYIKVALHLPEMTRGMLLSLRWWTGS